MTQTKWCCQKEQNLQRGTVYKQQLVIIQGDFFAGVESRLRGYGHKIEDISRLVKQYSYFQVYIGWRLKAPDFAKKSLDWVNKISPVDFD